MKLETLKSSKLEAFKKNEVENPFIIAGEAEIKTTCWNSDGSDVRGDAYYTQGETSSNCKSGADLIVFSMIYPGGKVTSETIINKHINTFLSGPDQGSVQSLIVRTNIEY